MDVQTRDDRLNALILEGKALEAFEEFYADEVVMQENSDPPTVGKDANRQRELEFFGSIADFHGAELLSSAASDDVSLSEWIYDVTFRDGTRLKLEQAAVRRWKDGKIVSERFYYHKG